MLLLQSRTSLSILNSILKVELSRYEPVQQGEQ